jgi:hypothetical protein
MLDSKPPKHTPSVNKGVVFLLVGGTVILITAVAVLFMRRGDPPPPEPEQEPTKSAVLDVPTPLVIAERTRPIAAPEPDAGAEQLSEKKAGGKRKGGFPENTGSIDTSIDTQEVNRYMNAHFDQVRACYERRLKTNSFLEGKLDLNIQIGLTGAVKGVSVNSDTVRDSEMLSCVKQVIRKWNFPKPKGGEVTIAKRFTFRKSAS